MALWRSTVKDWIPRGDNFVCAKLPFELRGLGLKIVKHAQNFTRTIELWGLLHLTKVGLIAAVLFCASKCSLVP